MGRLKTSLLVLSFASVSTFSLLSNANVFDKKPFTGTAKELLAAGNKAVVTNSPAVVMLSHTQRFAFDEAGRRTTTLYNLYKVTSSEGVSGWASTSASWAPWYQQKPRIRARVIAPNGTVHTLEPNQLIEDKTPTGSAHTYSDHRRIRAPLPSVSVGSIVEEEIIFSNRRRYSKGGEAAAFFVGGAVPWQRARLTIEAPAKLKYKVLIRNLKGVKRTKRKRGSRIVETFAIDDVPAFVQPEPHLAASERRYRFVSVSIGTWRAISTEYAAIVDDAIKAGPVPELVSQLKRGSAKSRDARIRAALKLVSENIRYTGLELGESAIVPFSPAETWKRKYGDCKDKATILTALLRGLGIRANVALIRSSLGENVEPTMPGLGSFNHAIVAVPEAAKGGRILWIDPTVELAGVGVLPQPDQNRLALIASRKGEKRPVRTPISSSRENAQREVRTITLPELGKAKIIETSIYSGALGVNFRGDVRSAQTEPFRKNIETYVAREYDDAKLLTFKTNEPTDLSRPMGIRVVANNAGMAVSLRNEATVYLDLSRVFDLFPDALRTEVKSDETPRKRKLFVFPFERELVWKINVPVGFEPRELPANKTETFGPATLTQTVRRSGSTITAIQRMTVGARQFKPSEVLALRKRVHLASANDVYINLDQTGMKLASADNLPAAANEIRKLIAQHPKEALHHIQLADVYMTAGLREDALIEAKLATRVEPTSAEAFGFLGYVHAQGDVGRWLQAGSSRREAIRATQRAIELDPKEGWFILNLARLEEHSDDGQAHRGDLVAAAKAYRKLRKLTDSTEHDINLLTVLVRSRRWKESRDFARTLVESAEVIGVRLTATMMLGGIDAVRAELGGLSATREIRATALSGAVGNLAIAREYDKARALAADAKSRGTYPATAEQQAQTLKKVNQHVPPNTLPKRPQDFAAALAASVTYGQPQLKALFTIDSEFARSAVNGHSITELSTLREFMFDVLMAGSTVKVEEASGWGWRVRWRMQYPGVTNQTVGVFVRRVRGSIRGVALDGKLDELGLGALKMLDRGKLDVARQILTWAAEEKQAPGFFKSLWRRNEKGDAATVRLAAASLLREKKNAKTAIRAFARCKAATKARRTTCRRSLALVLFATKEYKAAVAHLEALRKEEPKNVVLGFSLFLFHSRAGDLKGAEKVISELEGSDGGNHDVVRLRGALLIAKGELKEALALSKSLYDETGEAQDANAVGWLSLFAGQLDDEIVSAVQGALKKTKSTSIANTLAVVQARRGKLTAAKVSLHASLESRVVSTASDLVVVGRIAQTLGLKKRARTFYKKAIAKDQQVSNQDSSDLARIWLKEL